jgi:uncharacterized protein (UPF0147 family)
MVSVENKKQSSAENLKHAIEIFQELQQDNTVSKNIRTKMAAMQKEIETAPKEELSLRVNKIMSELEEVSSDINLPMFIRTQIWSLASLLESLC